MKIITYRLYEREWKEPLFEGEKDFIVEMFNLYKRRGKNVYITYLTEEEVDWGL